MEMELRSSSPTDGLSPPNCVSDPEEKEISDDDDDDRNHKHRRQESRSQSLDGEVLVQPYRKRNRPFENGQSDRQSHYSLNREFTKFENRHPVGVNFSRFSGEHAYGRGRGRDYQRDLRFGSIDVASQMAHSGSIPSAIFSGRGLSNVPIAASASWNNFGPIPGIPNGAIDAINPLGMPRICGPQLHPSLNMGIQRQHCRDFEERGFCLRGDMCPMEHGINRIVVEDVKSLSQFNLPVSLPNAHLLGTSPGSGFMPSASVSTGTVINNRGLNSRTSKSSADDDALNQDGVYSRAANAGGADLYDPDQPLWNNDHHESSTPFRELQQPNFVESESLMGAELSDRAVRSSGATTGLQSTNSSVWGRLNSKNKLEWKEKFYSRTKPFEVQDSKSEIHEASGGTQGTSHLGNPTNVLTIGPKTIGSAAKLQNDMVSNAKKPNQKAQRTLFVNCIPLKDNKKENLLSHFRRFGEVIDIYIPVNSERAFVQFSNREEAERALKAPDAVMGSRFIKLWWANRDSIPDKGMSSGNNVPITFRDMPAASGSFHAAVANKGIDTNQYATSKVATPKTLNNPVTAANDSKPATANGPKEPPQLQKKVESLALLKEELRKKQEMLEQKRNEFRLQLDKLAKQATGFKSEVSGEQAIKKQKVDSVKAGKAADDDVISRTSLQAGMLGDKVSNVASFASEKFKTSASALHDPQSLKQTASPTATSGVPYMNKYKLDNRFTAFKICAPLPPGLENDPALREHFSPYGEISSVEMEELDEEDSPNSFNDSETMRNCSACISFATSHSAERAFLNGKSWNGHNLKFIWIASNIPNSGRSSGESSSGVTGTYFEAQSADEKAHDNSQDACGSSPNKTCPKSLNKLSCGSSRSSGEEHSPVADAEDNSVFEAQSSDKSVSYIPLEADEPGNRDAEVQEEAAGDNMQSGVELRAGGRLLSGERDLP